VREPVVSSPLWPSTVDSPEIDVMSAVSGVLSSLLKTYWRG
jgi:hypothetical protein